MSPRAAKFLLEYDTDWGFPRKQQNPREEVWGHSTEGTAAAIAGLHDRRPRRRGVRRPVSGPCRHLGFEPAKYCFERGTPYGDHYVTGCFDWSEHG